MVTSEDINIDVIVTLYYAGKFGSNKLEPVEQICKLISCNQGRCIVSDGNYCYQCLDNDVYPVFEKLGVKARSKEDWKIKAREFIEELEEEINNG